MDSIMSMDSINHWIQSGFSSSSSVREEIGM